ncbi:gamma-glutamyltranspeptidase/glutathione hydrolase [Amorphus suaedae]
MRFVVDPSRLFRDPYSSRHRPLVPGRRAAVSAAHPWACAAATEVLGAGGNAADATIAAQAVLSVVMPEAGGLGGDGFFLVRVPGGDVTAINAAGRSASVPSGPIGDDGTSVTTPGLVAGWGELSSRFGNLSLERVLAPAAEIAAEGFPIRGETHRAVRAQAARLQRGGAETWPFLAAGAGATVVQPRLAETLRSLGVEGPRWFHEGPLAGAIARAVQARGGTLSEADIAAHRSDVGAALELAWGGARVFVQPPMSQGVLLLAALKGVAGLDIPPDRLDHAAIETIQAVFALRDRVGEGAALLDAPLEVDLERASRRAGPRSYLHTAGVAAADATGMVVSSLMSVFDDFGSAIHVPEGGFVLNNRAAGFTNPPNDYAPGRLPVHTLAPALVEAGSAAFALATPGADGQVQTLLQILLAVASGTDLARAIDAPRWRSEEGRLLVEAGHASGADLAALGHLVESVEAGDTRFGGIVCAGLDEDWPFAVSDWRRENWTAAC